jgi:HlyD family secretion protein
MVVVMLLLSALVLSACQWGDRESGPAMQGGPGAPAEAEGALVASGTLQADGVRLASELGGRIVEVRVRAGEAVRAGQALVVLDSTPLLTRLSEAQAEVTSSRADLALARAGPRAEEVAARRATVALAEAQRDGALAAWENAQQAVENPQELDARIVEARTQVELAEQGVELAEAQLAQEQLLRDQRQPGTVEREIADLQVRAYEHALAAAQADQETAQTLLNWLWVIREEPLGLIAQAHGAEGQYRLAEAGLEVERARLADLRADPTPQEVAVAQAALDLAQAKADVLRLQQDKFTLGSPLDGVVLEQVLRAGEVAAPAATILTLADLRVLDLVVYVPENRVGWVRLDQPVTVTVDAFPERRFEGRVTRIGNEPEFTPRNVATQEERLNTFYQVEIALPNPEGLLKPGMPAEAVFGVGG